VAARAADGIGFDPDQDIGCQWQPNSSWQPKEDTMPIDTIMILSGIVFAFLLFAVVLMWSDLYSRKAQQQSHRR
jgi:hypothetical protein